MNNLRQQGLVATTTPQREQQLSLHVENEKGERNNINTSLLQLPSCLCGRKEELETLKRSCRGIFQRQGKTTTASTTTQAEILLVSGVSGAGKTQLVDAFLNDMSRTENDIFCIRGKFEHARHDEFAPLAAAIAMFVQELEQRRTRQQSTNDYDIIRQRMQQVIAEEQDILTAILPSLKSTMKYEKDQQCTQGQYDTNHYDTDNSTSLTGKDATVRFRYLFCDLMASMCSAKHPVILFLDDLQWATTVSLELIRTLLLTESIQGLVIVGACRHNEVALDSDLAVMLRKMEDEENLNVSHVALEGLTVRETLELTAQMLNVTPDLCTEVGSLLFDECKGHPLHTLQMLRALLDSDTLVVNAGAAFMTTHAVNDKFDNFKGKDAEDLVFDMLRKLPPSTQIMLSTASCLGAEFEQSFLSMAMGFTATTTEACQTDLSTAMATQFLCLAQRQGGLHFQKYRFVHDVVQQASKRLIDPEERSQVHHDIAMNIWNACDKDKEQPIEQSAVSIARQLENCLNLLCEEHERVRAAKLFVLAASRSKYGSDFVSAALYLRHALTLLPPKSNWKDYYSLSLTIRNSLAEMEHVLGHNDRSEALSRKAVAYGRVLLDKIPAYINLIHSLGSRSRNAEAVSIAIKVLTLLGERIPKNPGIVRTLRSLFKTKMLIQKSSSEHVLQLPKLENLEKLAAMQIMSMTLLYAFVLPGNLPALLSSRMVQLTYEQGTCQYSSMGFAFYSMTSQLVFGDIVDSQKSGRIALDVEEANELSDFRCRVYNIVYGLVYPAVLDLRECLEWENFAFRVGMITGDSEFAMLCLHHDTAVQFYAGFKLDVLVENALRTRKLMIRFGQANILFFHEPFLLMAAGIAEIEVPYATREKQDLSRDGLIRLAKASENETVLAIAYKTWGMEHFWKGDYETALCCFEKFHLYIDKIGFAFRFYPIFAEGMSALYLAKKARHSYFERRPFMLKARRAIKYFRKFIHKMPKSLLHRLDLLEGLWFQVRGAKVEIFHRKYMSAYEIASKQEIRCDAALAQELIARALLENSNHIFATESALRESLHKSRDLYQDWGSKRKYAHLSTLLQQNFA